MEALAWILYSTGYLAVGLVMLFFAKKVFDVLTPYSVKEQLTERDNPALGVLLVGFLLGVIAVICAVFSGDTEGTPTIGLFMSEMIDVLIYGALGIVLLFISGIINDKAILNKFSNHTEIIDSRNTAVGTIMGMSYIGSGLIIAGAIYGSSSLLSAIVMFFLGQAVIVVFAKVYQAATRYDDQEEIGKKANLAAGMAMGGSILAFSLVLMKGAAIPPAEALDWAWADRLLHFAYYAIAGCVLLVASHFISDRIFLPGVRLADEIAKDRNINAGLMETGLALSMGAILSFCL